MKPARLLRGLLLVWLCSAGIASGQRRIVASTNPDRKGTGDLSVSYQAYYNQINGRTVANTQGSTFAFRHFFPERGLLTAQLEPLANSGGFAIGENYVQLQGLPWKGRHWDFAAGDFRVNTSLVDVPFTNLPLPYLSLRGAKAAARTGNWSYSVYAGAQTLSQGNRVPFRERVPQNTLGVDASGDLLQRLQVGFRFLHLTSPEERVANEPLFFPVNRQFTRASSFQSQANLQLGDSLNWFTEVGLSSSSGPGSPAGRSPSLSYVTGPALHTSRLAVRASYVRQGADYLPVVGYFLGDRRGPNVEASLNLGRLSLSGTWLRTRNNLERNPQVPDFFSRQSGGGFSLRIPADFFLSGSVSNIDLETRSQEAGLLRNANRQYQLMLSRPLFRHNLHATVQRLDIWIRDTRQRVQFFEFADNYTWRRFSGGAAVRWQRFDAEQRKDSFFVRTSAQMNLRRFSLFAYWEKGKDLANASLFATNQVSISVIGLTWEAPHKTTVRMEAFRSNLNSVVNPESAFVLSSQGFLSDSILSRSNDWSLLLRVTRQFEWGESLSFDSGGLAHQQAPLTGTLGGFVKVRTLSGAFGAPDVWVVTDFGESAKTDASGYFEILKAPQGRRLVSLDADRLPADFNPGETNAVSTLVRAEQSARVELEVIPLQSLGGAIADADGNPAEGVAVRLLPNDQYTTTTRNGRFGFYNLPEGDYVIELVENTLPENGRLVTPRSFPASVRYGTDAAAVYFRFEVPPTAPKPLREVIVEGEQPAVLPLDSPKQLPRRQRHVIARATAQSTD